MSGRFTVTVEVKEVIDPRPIEDSKGYAVKGLTGAPVLAERQVIDRLRVVVSAVDEADAIRRVLNMLETHQDSILVLKGPVDGEAARPV